MRSIGDNRKGLSAIVATLIIILLVLVAVGILWVVIRNVVDTGAKTITLNQKCLDVQIEAGAVTAVNNETNPWTQGIYSVTFSRKAGGDDIGGIKLNFFNATKNSGVVEFGSAIGVLDTVTNMVQTGLGSGGNVTNATRMDYTIYFVNDRGEEQICSSTKSEDLS